MRLVMPFKTWFLNLKIRYKLMLSFILLIIIPTLVISSLYFINSKKILIEKTNKYTNDILTEVQKSIELNLKDINSVFFNILENNDVQSTLLELKRNPQMSHTRKFELANNISNNVLLKIFSSNQIIKAVYLKSYSSSDFMPYAVSGSQIPILNDHDVSRILESSGKAVWIKTDKDYLTYARGINSITDFTPLGYIVIYYYEKDLCSIYSDILLSANSRIFIVDSDGYVISDNDKSRIGIQLTDSYMSQISSNRDIFLGDGAFDGQKYYIATRMINSGQWKLVYQISEREFNKEEVTLLKLVLLVTSVCILIVMLFGYMLSSVISKPIITLTKQMKQAKKGDYSGYSNYVSNDEVGLLSLSFNEMLKSTNNLIRVVYEKELIKQRVELENLKLQINPHFLYNTLEVINWSARCNGIDDIGIIAKALGDLMRKALDSYDFIPFNQEVEVINNYLTIQKFRYEDRISYTADIDPRIMEAVVPKFILQPIVENSIIHGIEPKLTQGSIRLCGTIEGNDILLTVEDDGVGIPKDVLETITADSQSREPSSTHRKIGLRNVNKRLQVIYGSGYGITVWSREGERTVVTIRLPYETAHDTEKHEPDSLK